MSSTQSASCYNIEKRRDLFESFGGLPQTTVQNKEWIYMLAEDTRQSLAIEGYFSSEEELENMLSGAKTRSEITNYFRAAQTLYDQALQYYRDSIDPPLSLPIVRHIHSELFRDIDNLRRGDFRKEAIQIHKAKVIPPPVDVEHYLMAAMKVMNQDLGSYPVLEALARIHTLFESIHPFHDGNGRTGRILLNYLAVSKGFPPIIIKGADPTERSRYYASLEEADKGFHKGFPDSSEQQLKIHLDEGNFAPLSELLCQSLLPQLDHLTALALEKNATLRSLAELSEEIGVKEGTLRQWVLRGKLIALKRERKLYSHPKLLLE